MNAIQQDTIKTAITQDDPNIIVIRSGKSIDEWCHSISMETCTCLISSMMHNTNVSCIGQECGKCIFSSEVAKNTKETAITWMRSKTKSYVEHNKHSISVYGRSVSQITDWIWSNHPVFIQDRQYVDTKSKSNANDILRESEHLALAMITDGIPLSSLFNTDPIVTPLNFKFKSEYPNVVDIYKPVIELN